jgi:hypothetical protein
LNQLHEDRGRGPPVGNGLPPPSFAASAQALATWLDVAREPSAIANPVIVAAIEDVANRLAAEHRTGRDKLLDAALQQVAAETARTALERLAWADGAVYHVGD